MEILAPAGSFEALKAAVYGGADAVYFGTENFNARKNAKNLTRDEITRGILFCREYGVKTAAALNILISQKEMDEALYEAEFLTKAGISSFIVQDIGLASVLRQCTNVPLCASTQASCHSLDGVNTLAELGFSRVVLARELEKKDIETIVQGTRIEVEVFAHGALCVCYSGQCYMSSVIGARSGNRGVCAQPCRLPYKGGYRLSLKDLCLLKYVKELENIGVSSLKIEGRMKSPEYVYAVTKAYSDAKKGIPYDPETEKELARIFSRDGFTNAYFLGKPGADMFGIRKENNEHVKGTSNKTVCKKIGLSVSANINEDMSVRISAITDDGFTAESKVTGLKPQNRESGAEELHKAFSRLGETPYFLKNTEFNGSGIFIPQSRLNGSRREIIETIKKMRLINTNCFSAKHFENISDKPTKTVYEGQFSSIEQIPEAAYRLSKIWLPLTVLCEKKAPSFIEERKIKPGAIMPRICEDREYSLIEKMLRQINELGITDVLCGNIGQINLLYKMGFTIHGDFGLNVFNAVSRDTYLKMGLSSITLSFELNLPQISEISTKSTGIIAYGRLPFMIMRNCIKTSCGAKEFLTDRMHKNFLITCSFGCRNELFNSDKLWLADMKIPPVGFARLLFTDEDTKEAEKVINAYVCSTGTIKENITRGLYRKKV